MILNGFRTAGIWHLLATRKAKASLAHFMPPETPVHLDPATSSTSETIRTELCCKQVALPLLCLQQHHHGAVATSARQSNNRQVSPGLHHQFTPNSDTGNYISLPTPQHHPLSWYSRHCFFQPCSGDVGGHCLLQENRPKWRSKQERITEFYYRSPKKHTAIPCGIVQLSTCSQDA